MKNYGTLVSFEKFLSNNFDEPIGQYVVLFAPKADGINPDVRKVWPNAAAYYELSEDSAQFYTKEDDHTLNEAVDYSADNQLDFYMIVEKEAYSMRARAAKVLEWAEFRVREI